jgi:nucleotide-binding universal stress UspA family protein
MFKKILLCTDGSPDAEVAAEYTVWLAQKLPAEVQILYVTDIRILEGPWLSDLSGALGAQPYPALVPRLQEIQRQKAAAILAAAQARCAKHNVPCQVAHETGGLVNLILQYEQNADLVVLGQHGEHAQWSGDLLGSSVERVVRASIKPSLVTPDEFREIKQILIAYDGSEVSGKALRAGMEIARGVNAEVTIVTVSQRKDELKSTELLEQAHQQAIAAQLVAHMQLLHGEPEVEILNHRLNIGADMIVMGAYGHTRIRELILGSTTSHVMRKSSVPVLLAR